MNTMTTRQTINAQVLRYIDYDYQDAAGRLVYQIVRKELVDGGKEFVQRHPDGQGDWIYSIKGMALVPYHLPEVLRIVQRGGLILLVEGEKCADVLNAAIKAAGLCAVATCNNGGAEQWGEEQSEYLKGAKVALLPDNDDRGRAHVEKAARALRGLATSIKLLELPGLAEKGDIADWLSAGHTIAELRALYHGAAEYTPPPEPEVQKPSKPVRAYVTGGDRPRLTAWAQAALDGETAELSRLADGRFHALKAAAANRLGAIAAHGLLTETECMAGLVWALESNGYTQKPGKRNGAAEKEARFYFKSGLEFPCQLPEAEDLPALERKEAPDGFVAYIPEKQIGWLQGVPIAVRGLFNAYQGNGPLLELIVEGKNAKLICDDQTIAVDCLVFVSRELKRGLTAGTIRTMIRTALDPHGVQFLRKIVQYNTDHSNTQIPDQLDPCPDFRRNPCGCVGRSPEYYQLLPIETILSNLARYINAPLIKQAFPDDSELVAPIRAEFLADLDRPNAESLANELSARYSDFIAYQPGFAEAMEQVRRDHRQIMYRLKNPKSAPIPPDMTYKNASEYKVACAYALVNSHLGGKSQLRRADLCALIGCKDGALPSIFSRAGIAVIKNQYSRRQIKSVAELRNTRPVFDKRFAGFPKFVTSSRSDERVKFGNSKAITFAEAELAAGAQVCVLYHQANRQVIRRLSQVVIDFMARLLAFLIALFTPIVEREPQQQELFPEPEQPAPDEPQAEPTPEPAEKKPPKPKKPTWEQKWIGKLAAAGTGLQVDFDALSGELAPLAVQLSLDALISEAPPPKPDLLITWIEAELGGKVTVLPRKEGQCTRELSRSATGQSPPKTPYATAS